MDAAIGDLLAITATKEDNHTDPFSPSTTSNSLPLTNMLDSAVSGATSGSTSPPSTSSSPSGPVSGMGGAKDFPYQQILTGTHNQLSLGTNHLLQQQQQRASGHSPINGDVPPGLSLPTLHQNLSQQLSQCQQTEQAILLQLKSLSPSIPAAPVGGAQPNQQLAPPLPQEQSLRQNLGQVTANIKAIKQQLALVTKLHTQHLSAQVSERQELPPSSTPTDTLEDVPSSSGGESSSRSSLAATPGDVKYGMQNLSLSDVPSISQSSARSISRLKRIISGNGQDGSNTVDRDGLELSEINSPSSSHSDPYVGEGGSSSIITTPSSVTTPSGTSSMFGSTRSVDEIPEFKPGVLWQGGSKGGRPPGGGGQHAAMGYSRSISVDHDMFSPDGPGMFGSTTPGAFTPQPVGHRNSLGSGGQYDLPRQYSPGQQRSSNSGGRYMYKTTISSSSRSTNNYRQTVGQGPGQGPSGFGGQDRRGNYGVPQQQQPQQQQTGRTTSYSSGQKQNQQKWSYDNNPWGMPVKSGWCYCYYK